LGFREWWAGVKYGGGACKGDWSTRLQENPQIILQLVVMIQLTSRRILRD